MLNFIPKFTGSGVIQFHFNGADLALVDKDNSIYTDNIDPKEFVECFKKKNSKLSLIKKADLFISKITDASLQDQLIIEQESGFEAVIQKFLEIKEPIYKKYRDDLYSATKDKGLAKFFKQKINYFNTFTQIKFDDYFKLIKQDLDDDQIQFLDKYEIKSSDELVLAGATFDKIVSKLDRIKDKNHKFAKYITVGNCFLSGYEEIKNLAFRNYYKNHSIYGKIIFINLINLLIFLSNFRSR